MPKYPTWTTELGLRVRAGNEGIGRVANISKDITTCGPISKYCRPYCYMGNPFYRDTKNITKCHSANTEIFKNIEKENKWSVFVYNMVSLIEKRNITMFRVNVNGDLISKNEIYAWAQIAEICSNTKFWIPTKRYEWFNDFDVRKRIYWMQNLSISLSVFFNMPNTLQVKVMNLGLPIAYTDTENKYNYKVCSKPCETCQWCFNTGKDVFLPLHGLQAKYRKKRLFDSQRIGE